MSVETTNSDEAVNCGRRFKRNRSELFARLARETLSSNSSSESRINFDPLSVKPVTRANSRRYETRLMSPNAGAQFSYPIQTGSFCWRELSGNNFRARKQGKTKWSIRGLYEIILSAVETQRLRG